MEPTNIQQFSGEVRVLARQILDELLPRLEKTSRKIADVPVMQPMDAEARHLITDLTDQMLSNVSKLEAHEITLEKARREHADFCRQVEGIVTAHLLDVGFDAANAKEHRA